MPLHIVMPFYGDEALFREAVQSVIEKFIASRVALSAWLSRIPGAVAAEALKSECPLVLERTDTDARCSRE